jgi:hypothetical protein
MKFNGNITLNALGQSEVQNLIAERFSATPAFFASEAGRLIYNTTSRLYYMNSGLGWVALATGGDASALQTEVDALESSIGPIVTSTGAFNAAALTGTNAVSATSITDAINKLDAAMSGKDELRELVDVAVGGRTDGQFLRYDLTSGKWVNHTLVTADITDLTASATELNFVKGVTSPVQGQFTTIHANLDQAVIDLGALVTTERTRATGIESGLRTDLSAEVTRATGVESTLTTNLAAEVTRATAAEQANASAVTTEAAARAAGDATNATAITAEATRATAAEGALSTRVTTEVADRTAADAALATTIATETTNRTTAVAVVQTAVDAEVSARAAADVAIRNELKAAIAGLTWQAPVDALASTLPDASALANGYRVANTTDFKIYTVTAGAFDAGVALADGAAFFDRVTDVPYTFTGTALVQFNGASSITAGAGLVKSGNTLSVVSSTATITVTEDSIDVAQSVLDSITTVATNLTSEISRAGTAEAGLGQRVTDEAAARAAAVTAEVAARNAAIAVEVTRATAAEQANASAIAAETTRAQAAEAAAGTATAAETTRAQAVETTLTANLAAEVSRATAAEGVNAAAIASEVTRATAAEGTNATAIAGEVSRAQAAEAALAAKVSKGYFLYDGAAAASHTVAHGIGSQFCNVTVIDTATSEQIIPQSVVFNSGSSLTVTFNVALACKVVVMGLGV